MSSRTFMQIASDVQDDAWADNREVMSGIPERLGLFEEGFRSLASAIERGENTGKDPA